MKKTLRLMLLATSFLALSPHTIFANKEDALVRALVQAMPLMTPHELFSLQATLNAMISQELIKRIPEPIDPVFCTDNPKIFTDEFTPLYQALIDNPCADTLNPLITCLKNWIKKDPSVFIDYRYPSERTYKFVEGDDQLYSMLGWQALKNFKNLYGIAISDEARKITEIACFPSDPYHYINIDIVRALPCLKGFNDIQTITFFSDSFADFEKEMGLLETFLLSGTNIKTIANCFFNDTQIPRIIPILQKMQNLENLQVPQNKVEEYKKALPSVKVSSTHLAF